MKTRTKLAYSLGLVAVLIGAFAIASGVFSSSSGAFAADPGQRSVTLTYDAPTQWLDGVYETTATVDVFVTSVGSGGPVLWGKGTMEVDPTGGIGHDTSGDPSGTIYNFTVTWYDGSQAQTAQIVQSFTKP